MSITGIFENDGAIDWLTDFIEYPDIIKIKSALRLTGDAKDYPDALDCEEALAAAAVVISLKNNLPLASLPHKQFELLQKTGFYLNEDLVPLAQKSTRHILKNSELKDLWEEDEMYGEWELGVKELIEELEKDLTRG
jgi:hypothetical protein